MDDMSEFPDQIKIRFEIVIADPNSALDVAREQAAKAFKCEEHEVDVKVFDGDPMGAHWEFSVTAWRVPIESNE